MLTVRRIRRCRQYILFMVLLPGALAGCNTAALIAPWSDGHPAASTSASAPPAPLPGYLSHREPIPPIATTSGNAVDPNPPMTVPGESAPRSVPPMNMSDMKGHAHDDM